MNILSKPGLWMQGLTTKEPDDAMIEVAIKSVEAVFDWRAFLAENESANTKKADSEKKNRTHLKVSKPTEKTSEKINSKTAADKPESDTAASDGRAKAGYDGKKRGANTTPIVFKHMPVDNLDDEEDEILVALDKYFDDEEKEQSRSSGK